MMSALEIAAGPVVASSGDRWELVSWAFVIKPWSHLTVTHVVDRSGG